MVVVVAASFHMAVFSVNLGQLVATGLSPSLVLEQNLLAQVAQLLWTRRPSCHPINSVKALKEAQSTALNQCLSSSFLQTASIPMDGILFLPCRQFSDARTTTILYTVEKI